MITCDLYESVWFVKEINIDEVILVSKTPPCQTKIDLSDILKDWLYLGEYTCLSVDDATQLSYWCVFP